MKNTLYKNLYLAKDKFKLNEIKNKAVIYQLVNLVNLKTYIGSTANFYRRFNEYLNPLYIARNLKKGNSAIMNALLKYGYVKFGIRILEVIEIEPSLPKLETRNIILKKEQFFIDLVKPEYNINKIAGSSLGRIFSEKVRKKMSLAKKGLPGNKKGAIFSDETKAGFREKSGKRLAVNMLNETNEKLTSFKSIQIASEATGISRNRISRCARGIRTQIIDKGKIYQFEYVKGSS